MNVKAACLSLLSLSLVACSAESQLTESCPAEPVVLYQPAKQAARLPQNDAEIRLLVFQGQRPMIALREMYEVALPQEPTWLSKRQPLELSGAPDPTLLSAEERAWEGQRVKLYKADGSFCEAGVTGLTLFGQLNSYDEELPETAQEAWEKTVHLGGVRLVATLDLAACEGALFARLASLPAPFVATPQEASPAQEAAALSQMKTLALYQKTQAEYLDHRKTEPGAPLFWENYEENKPAVRVFTKGAETFVTVTAVAGIGCGGFGGSLFAVWRVADGLTLLHQSREAIDPSYVLDTNHDQSFEWLEGPYLLQWSNGSFQQSQSVEIASDSEGCGC